MPGTQIQPLPGPGLRHPVCTSHMLYPSHLSPFSHAHKVLEINPAATRDFLGVPPAHSSTIPGSLCHRAGYLHKDQSSTKKLVPPGIQGLRKTRAQSPHNSLVSLRTVSTPPLLPGMGPRLNPFPLHPKKTSRAVMPPAQGHTHHITTLSGVAMSTLSYPPTCPVRASSQPQNL